MDKLYVGDTEVRIEADAGIDVTTITSAKIFYRKPHRGNYAQSSWAASFTTGTVVYYDITSSTDIDVPGLWTFWPVLTFPDTHIITGTPFTIRAYRPGFGGC